MSEYTDYNFPTAESSHSHNYLLPSIQPLLEAKKTILDVGCGNGSFAFSLIKQGYNVFGVDASPTGIELAKKQSPERFFLQDLTTDGLPEELKDIKFNTIISTEVVEHLYNPRAYITFCKEILVQNGGGDIILSTPYHGYLKNLVIALLGKFDKHADPLWDGGHIKLWSRATLSALLEEQGFKVTHFIGSGRFPYLWKSMVIRAEI